MYNLSSSPARGSFPSKYSVPIPWIRVSFLVLIFLRVFEILNFFKILKNTLIQGTVLRSVSTCSIGVKINMHIVCLTFPVPEQEHLFFRILSDDMPLMTQLPLRQQPLLLLMLESLCLLMKAFWFVESYDFQVLICYRNEMSSIDYKSYSDKLEDFP